MYVRGFWVFFSLCVSVVSLTEQYIYCHSVSIIRYEMFGGLLYNWFITFCHVLRAENFVTRKYDVKFEYVAPCHPYNNHTTWIKSRQTVRKAVWCAVESIKPNESMHGLELCVCMMMMMMKWPDEMNHCTGAHFNDFFVITRQQLKTWNSTQVP